MSDSATKYGRIFVLQCVCRTVSFGFANEFRSPELKTRTRQLRDKVTSSRAKRENGKEEPRKKLGRAVISSKEEVANSSPLVKDECATTSKTKTVRFPVDCCSVKLYNPPDSIVPSAPTAVAEARLEQADSESPMCEITALKGSDNQPHGKDSAPCSQGNGNMEACMDSVQQSQMEDTPISSGRLRNNVRQSICHVEEVTPLLVIPATILNVECNVLIDSGAAGNFISLRLVKMLGCLQHPLKQPTAARVANGQIIPITMFVRLNVKMSTFRTRLCFHVTEMPNDMILGYPFLLRFDPIIDWKNRFMIIMENNREHKLQGLSAESHYFEYVHANRILYVEPLQPTFTGSPMDSKVSSSTTPPFSMAPSSSFQTHMESNTSSEKSPSPYITILRRNMASFLTIYHLI